MKPADFQTKYKDILKPNGQRNIKGSTLNEFVDDLRLVFDEVNTFVSEMVTTGSVAKGAITTSTTFPETNAWGIAEAGTYPNAGGQVVGAGKIAFLSKVGTTWSKVELTIPAAPTAKLPYFEDISGASIPEKTQFIVKATNKTYRVLDGQTLTTGQTPTTNPEKVAIISPNVDLATTLNTTSTTKAETGKSVGDFTAELFKGVQVNRETLGVSNFVFLERGGLNTSGVETAYTTAQPRMRTGFIPLQSVPITISSSKHFFVAFYDVSKKFLRSSFTGTWTNTNVVVGAGVGFYRICAKNTNDAIISDADLKNTVFAETINNVNVNNARLINVESSLPFETKTLVWNAGYPDNSTQIIIPETYAIYSSLFKNNSGVISASVNSGYKIGARIYKAQDTTASNLVASISSAQSISFTLDSSLYVRLFVIADSTSTNINPSSFAEVGLVYSGLIGDYQDLIIPARARKVQTTSKATNSGFYNDSKTYTPQANRKAFLYTNRGTGEFVRMPVDAGYLISVRLFSGTKLLYSDIDKRFIDIYLPSNQDLCINIRKSDNSDFATGEFDSLSFDIITEERETTGFINPKRNQLRSNYNADEFGMNMKNTDNSDILNELIEYVYKRGGGTIQLPVGVYDFRKRITAKSRVNIVGYGRGLSLLRMVGTTRWSLFDNLDQLISNCAYRGFTIDGYDLNPADGVYSTDMKAFNYHSVKDCVFTEITLQGIPASGFGIDYLHGVVIANNHVIEAGRLWMPTGGANMQGGSGIGIGTGGWSDEAFSVYGNVLEKCGQNGIFVEDQGIFNGANTPPGRGSIIANNTILDGRYNGLALRGNNRIKMIGNNVYKNANAGFFADKYLRDCDISNNTFVGNKYGIYAVQGDTRGSYDNTFNNNLIKGSTTAGILVNGDNSRDFDFRNNSLVDNPKALIFSGNSQDFYFDGNKIRRSSQADLDISGTHTDLVFKNTSYRGTKLNTGVFVGNTTEVEL